MGRHAEKSVTSRRPSKAVEIVLSETDREKWISELSEYYSKTFPDMTPGDRFSLSVNVIKECEKGWPHGPREFAHRIAKKTGYNAKSLGAVDRPNPNKGKQKTAKSSNYKTIRDSLPVEDQEYWDQKKEAYLKEFEFNESSDMSILDQILVEEIIQKRLSIEQLVSNDINSLISKVQSEALKRLLDLQTKLGITREQRKGDMNKIDGNVASLALALDEKIIEIDKEMKQLAAEEEAYQEEKLKEPPINILPPTDKLADMLGLTDEGIISTTDYVEKIAEAVIKPTIQPINYGETNEEGKETV